MNARTKLGGYALVLTATFGGAYAVGSAVGPVDSPPPDEPKTPITNGEMHEDH